MLDLDLEDLEGDPSTDQYRAPASIGARIAAAASPTPVQQTPDAAEAKVRQTQQPIHVRPDTSDIPIPQTREQAQGYPVGQAPQVQLDPGKMPSDIVRSNVTPNEVPSPVASSPTTTTLPGLMQQRSAIAKPIDPNTTDPNTGKKIYRMGIGQRILGGIADFGEGWHGQQPSVYIGPGATNARYARDTAMQQKKLGAIDTDIGNQEKLAQQQRQLYDDAIKQSYEAQLADARQTAAAGTEKRGEAAITNAESNAEQVPSKINLNNARGAQATSTANQKDATRPTKVMGMRTFEKQDDGSWKDIGPAPTKQFNPNSGAGRGSKSDFDKIERDKQTAIRAAEQKAQTAVMKIKPPPATDLNEFMQYSQNPQAWKEQKKQEIYGQLEQEKQQAQADYEARIQEKGGSVVSPPSQRTINTPPPNRVNPPAGGGTRRSQGGQTVSYKGQQYTVGQPVMIDGKPHNVRGINPKTGKLIVDP